jgi:signal peptidase I
MSAKTSDADLTGAAPAEAGEAPQTSPPTRSRRRGSLSWLVVIALAAAVSILLRAYVVQTFWVPTGSMEPTLQPNDRILVLKIGFSLQRGAIVVFRHPPRDTEPPLNEDLVKRIIGLPGETISSVGNTVYINGKPLSEPWLPKNISLGPPIPPQKIAPGHYFMMGDNRDDSLDSRAWGTLPRKLIIGRVFLIVWRHSHPVFHIP